MRLGCRDAILAGVSSSAAHKSRPYWRGNYRLAKTLARTAVVVLAAVSASPALSGTAHAHTDLASSTPAAGQTLRLPPTLVRLKFNEAVNKDFADLTLAVGRRAPVILRAEVRGGNVTADVPASARAPVAEQPQPWRVAYRVVSVDGHPVTGSITFKVNPSRASTSAPTSPSDASPSARTQTEATAENNEPGVRSSEVSEPGAAAWLPTAAIGLFVASAVGVALVWLVRGRRRDQRE